MKKAMNSEPINSWIGAGIAIGAAVFAPTKDPVWVGVGIDVSTQALLDHSSQALGSSFAQSFRLPLRVA